MGNEMTLLEAMQAALNNIREQSPEEYIENVRAHQDAPIALALRDLGMTPYDALEQDGSQSRCVRVSSDDYVNHAMTYNLVVSKTRYVQLKHIEPLIADSFCGWEDSDVLYGSAYICTGASQEASSRRVIAA